MFYASLWLRLYLQWMENRVYLSNFCRRQVRTHRTWCSGAAYLVNVCMPSDVDVWMTCDVEDVTNRYVFIYLSAKD